MLAALWVLAVGCAGKDTLGTPPDAVQLPGVTMNIRQVWQPDPPAEPSFGSYFRDAAANQYFVNTYEGITCLGPEGSLRWKYPVSYSTGSDSILEWALSSSGLRFTERIGDNSGGYRSFLVALAADGQVAWQVELPGMATNGNDNGLAVTSDGWAYVLGDEPSGYFDTVGMIDGVDPQGNVAWQLHAPPAEFSDGYTSIGLQPDNHLIACLDRSGLDWIDRAGHVTAHTADAGFGAQILGADAKGAYLLDPEPGLAAFHANFERGDLPDYYKTGRYDGGGSALTCAVQGSAPLAQSTDMLVDQAALLPQGGVVLGGDAGEVAAFDRSGRELWRYFPDQSREARLSWAVNTLPFQRDSSQWRPSVRVVHLAVGRDGAVAVATTTGLLYVVNPNGTLRWSRPGATGAPLNLRGFGVDAGNYTTGSDYAGNGIAWAADGSLWSAGELQFDGATGALLDDRSAAQAGYVLDAGDGIVRNCRDACCLGIGPQGEELWRTRLPDRISGRPGIGPSGQVFVPTERGGLFALDAAGGILWHRDLPARVEAQPVVAGDGNLYLLDIAGDLLSLTPGGGRRWLQSGYNTNNWRPGAGPDGVAVVDAQGDMQYVLGSGATKWTYAAGFPFTAPANVNASGQVFSGCRGGWPDYTGIALGIDSDGQRLFSSPVKELEINSPPVLLPDGSAVFGYVDSFLEADPFNFYTVVRVVAPSGRILRQEPPPQTYLDYQAGATLPIDQTVNGRYVMLWGDGELQLLGPGGAVIAQPISQEALWGMQNPQPASNGWYYTDNAGRIQCATLTVQNADLLSSSAAN